jgi:GntR family histidine utilization transcriptional repressor
MTAKENISLHQRILSDLADRILSGEWPPGYRIPFEHELMVQYGCSRMTVSKVLTHLVNTGMIERRRKAGSFVSRPHAQSLVLEISDIKAEVAALGLPYSFDILARGKRKSSKNDRAFLDLRPNSSVLELVCCHYAGRQPFCFEERLINLAAVPEAADENFAELPPGSWLMSRVPWTTAEHRISATEATAPSADTLKLPLGKPCLVVERKTWISDHTVTFVRLTYPGNLHELVARFAPEQSDRRLQNANASTLRPNPVGAGAAIAKDTHISSKATPGASDRPIARPGVVQRR